MPDTPQTLAEVLKEVQFEQPRPSVVGSRFFDRPFWCDWSVWSGLGLGALLASLAFVVLSDHSAYAVGEALSTGFIWGWLLVALIAGVRLPIRALRHRRMLRRRTR